MFRTLLTLLSIFLATPTFATGFSDVVSKRCADTNNKISESFSPLGFDQAPSSTGFAETYFGLPMNLALTAKVDEFKVTFNCMKSGRSGGALLDSAMVFIDMSYASNPHVQEHRMKGIKLPDEVILTSIGELVSKTLAIAPADGRNLAQSCFSKAISSPTQKSRDQKTDEKSFNFNSGPSPEVECTRRERLDSGAVTFMMHYRIGAAKK